MHIRVVVFVRGRDVHVPGCPDVDLRVSPDQVAQAVGRLRDEVGRVDPLAVGHECPGERGVEEDDRREIAVTFEERFEPGEPLFRALRQMVGFQIVRREVNEEAASNASGG
jgi:hypothetical protein